MSYLALDNILPDYRPFGTGLWTKCYWVEISSPKTLTISYRALGHILMGRRTLIYRDVLYELPDTGTYSTGPSTIWYRLAGHVICGLRHKLPSHGTRVTGHWPWATEQWTIFCSIKCSGGMLSMCLSDPGHDIPVCEQIVTGSCINFYSSKHKRISIKLEIYKWHIFRHLLVLIIFINIKQN